MTRALLKTHRVRSAAVAALLVTAAADRAWAADWYTGASPVKPSDDWIVAVDASAAASSNGSQFAAVSATIAPERTLSTSGSRIRVEGLAGTYKFDSSRKDTLTRGNQVAGALLGGYEWLTPRSSFATYGGLAVRNSTFSDTLPGHAADGTKVGFKGVLEYFARPTDRTMLSAYGSYSTNFNAYYARLRWGVTPFGGFYIGPEVTALGDDYFQEWRLGAHLTALQIGPLQFGVSGGYLMNKAGKSGGYGTLDVRAVY